MPRRREGPASPSPQRPSRRAEPAPPAAPSSKRCGDEAARRLDALEGVAADQAVPASLPQRLYAVVALTVLGAVFGLAEPWPLAIILDNVLEDQHPAASSGRLRRRTNRLGDPGDVVIARFLITAIGNAFSVINNYLGTKIDQNMILDFRSDLFRARPAAVAGLPRRAPTGALI